MCIISNSSGFHSFLFKLMGAQWLSGRVLDSRLKGRGFEPHRRHCIVSLSKNINPSLVLVQRRKTCPYTTERLLMGRKESNQTNKIQTSHYDCSLIEDVHLLFCVHLIIFDNLGVFHLWSAYIVLSV